MDLAVIASLEDTFTWGDDLDSFMSRLIPTESPQSAPPKAATRAFITRLRYLSQPWPQIGRNRSRAEGLEALAFPFAKRLLHTVHVPR